jgi:hypothetical protein
MSIECDKKQKVIKKDQTIYRCMHRQCDAHGHTITDEACAVCPLRAYKHVKPCGKHVFRPAENLEAQASEVELLKAISQESDDVVIEATPDGSPPPNYPAMSTQMWLYKEALLRWNRAGRPVRSAEEVDNILATHCMKCDWYDTEAKRCKGCGCKVTTSSVAVFNKIKMATEHCPKELW